MRKLLASILLSVAGVTIAAPDPCPEVLGLGVLAKTTDKEILKKLDDLGCRYSHYAFDHWVMKKFNRLKQRCGEPKEDLTG